MGFGCMSVSGNYGPASDKSVYVGTTRRGKIYYVLRYDDAARNFCRVAAIVFSVTQ